jgi:dTDP-4-amino-4,6-dideoxygalactose transaminase
MEPKYHHTFIGGNFRMDPLQAALLAVKLPHLPEYNRARAQNAAYYSRELGTHPRIANNTADAPADAALLLPVDFSGASIWNQFTLRVIGGAPARDSLKTWLTARDIGCDIYYPLTLDQQPCFKNIGRGGETIQAAHRLASEVLSIPIYPDLTNIQQEAVVAAIRGWLDTQG